MDNKKIKSLKNSSDARNITAIYVRVSTDFQFEEGYSIEAQQEKLIQWCKLKDYNNYEVYQDGGWSGSNLERPAMKKLISDIVSGKIKRVVVYKLDRLSRSQKDTLYLLEDLFIPNDVEFYSMNENFDTSTPYGKAMIGILSVFAQLERENIKERTRMGMYERVKDGFWMGGGAPPFGYDYDSNLNILVPNSHAEDVKKIFELYLEGYSTTQLSKMFPVSGDRQISNILSRETYLGKIRYNDEIFEGKHAPLIDENTWHKVQLLKEKRSTKGITTSSYLLTGLLVCGKCGAKMRYQKWTENKVKIYCYSQQKSKLSLVKDPNCDNPKIDADELERIVLEDLFRITDKVTFNSDKLQTPQAKRLSGLAVLEERHAVLTTKIKNLYNLYAEDENEVLLETIRENQNDLAKVSKLLQSEKASVNAVTQIAEDKNYVRNLRSKWNGMTMQEKHRALRICIESITVTGEEINIKYLI